MTKANQSKDFEEKYKDSEEYIRFLSSNIEECPRCRKVTKDIIRHRCIPRLRKDNARTDYDPIAVLMLIIIVLFLIYVIGKANGWW